LQRFASVQCETGSMLLLIPNQGHLHGGPSRRGHLPSLLSVPFTAMNENQVACFESIIEACKARKT